MSLTSLGLTKDEERAYRYLLRSPRAEPAELDVPDSANVVVRLKALGLVDDSLNAVPPAAAVDGLVRHRMEQAARELNQLGSAWDIIRDLTEEQRVGRPVELVERIETRAEVNRLISASTHNENMMAKPLPSGPNRYAEAHRRRFERRLADGLISRTLVTTAALDMPEEMEYARGLHLRGDIHRVTAEPFRTLLILDRKVAFVPIATDSNFDGALLIRQPGIVDSLIDLYEGLWERATDIDDIELAPVEWQVLQALATYEKDETAARAMNISLRKYRTHVADLMARLGATTRFQAALAAKERGWL